ncbi:MAG TPA: pyridoxal phosphate-dependent aminotransferase [Bacteroidales bacterium]|nr:pyridoxal phosphate-dependent aminotransferase [Bacteroidales bacterium]
MQTKTLIDRQIVDNVIERSGVEDVGHASIRELVKIVNEVEELSGEEFVRMEMGVPGLNPSGIGIEAEIEALKRGVASKYPMIEGIKPLKQEIARFVKNFLNVDVKPEACIPTVGSMMGGFATFLVANRTDRHKEGTLFIDPGFPVQKQQCRVLGQEYQTFDVYNYRGEKLRDKLESYLSTGKISTLLYSNPNNPSWICFTEEELRIIGELATKYDVIVIEDLAYFAMDFRKDMSKPGEPPYQPSVANYTKNFILLISSSKSFSYAGQRIGMMVVSTDLYQRKYPDLKRYYTSDSFGHAMIYGALYAISAGTGHSAQYALAAILKAVNDGEYNFVEVVREYGEKAKIMKKLFTSAGFDIVYEKDINEPIADGFYFTLSYPGFSGTSLIRELLYYGISAISLDITGSEHSEGLRACVSQVRRDQFPGLEERLKHFNENHAI